VNTSHNASVNSSGAHSSPAISRTFAHVSIPGGGAFEILSMPRVRDLPTPGGGEAPT